MPDELVGRMITLRGEATPAYFKVHEVHARIREADQPYLCPGDSFHLNVLLTIVRGEDGKLRIEASDA